MNKFTVVGDIKTKDRPRKQKACRGCAHSRMVTSNSTRTWEQDIQKQLVSARVIPGPVKVGLAFHLRSRKYKMCDLDNLEKAVLDALNTVCYEDDRFIVEKHSSKQITDGLEYVSITITEGG